jgi:hypothetical protein
LVVCWAAAGLDGGGGDEACDGEDGQGGEVHVDWK